MTARWTIVSSRSRRGTRTFGRQSSWARWHHFFVAGGVTATFLSHVDGEPKANPPASNSFFVVRRWARNPNEIDQEILKKRLPKVGYALHGALPVESSPVAAKAQIEALTKMIETLPTAVDIGSFSCALSSALKYVRFGPWHYGRPDAGGTVVLGVDKLLSHTLVQKR